MTKRPDSRSDDGDQPDRTRELRPAPAARPAADESAFETTALIDATSMEGLQASSRRGGSMPPPPTSDAQPTSVLDTNKLTELVGQSGTAPQQPQPGPTVRPASSSSSATASGGTPSRAKYTPTLRSANLEAVPAKAGIRVWPLAIGILIFGAGVGTFLGARALPKASSATTIELVVRAEPSKATIKLDDELLAGNPHTSVRPRDARKRTIVVEAEGHAPQRIDLVLDTSSTLEIVLDKTDKAR